MKKLLEIFRAKRETVKQTGWQEYARILRLGDAAKPADVERLQKLSLELRIELTEERLAADAEILKQADELAQMATGSIEDADKLANEAQEAADAHGRETFRMRQERDDEWSVLNNAAIQARGMASAKRGNVDALERLRAQHPDLLDWKPKRWDPVEWKMPEAGTREQLAIQMAGGNFDDPESMDRAAQDWLVTISVDTWIARRQLGGPRRNAIPLEEIDAHDPAQYASVMTSRRRAIREAAGDESEYRDKQNIAVAKKRLKEHRDDEAAFQEHQRHGGGGHYAGSVHLHTLPMHVVG